MCSIETNTKKIGHKHHYNISKEEDKLESEQHNQVKYTKQ